MDNPTYILVFISGFAIVSLAAKQIGAFFAKANLPLISGFLFTGVIAGPYLLALIPAEATRHLRFVDEIALAFIAFAAGNELFLRELKGQFRSIRYMTVGLVVSTFVLGSLAVFLMADIIPFMKSMQRSHRLAVSLLAGAILVARSPSSAIAVVNELRAKGPFTKTALGVTVIMDVVVITLFAVNVAIADALLTQMPVDIRFMALLIAELALSVGAGYLLGKLIQTILSLSVKRAMKTAMLLLSGYGVFVLAENIRHASHSHLPFELVLEPLLICMIGSFVTTNYSHYRAELMKTLHGIAPAIYIAFFTLTGASLALDVLAQSWGIALALFFIRLLAIFTGAFVGGTLAGESFSFNRMSWMAFITQAGVGLGLAKGITVAFPEWGTAFATIIIAVIVLNQIVGPPLFKWAIYLAGEAHPRAETQTHDTGIRDAVIFGLEGQSLALAGLLKSNGWEVRIATPQVQYAEQMADDAEVEICPLPGLTLSALSALGVGQAEAIVTMLSDEENYQICELAYEHYGTQNMIVRLNSRTYLKRFHELGALIVDPSTAMVSLLDQFVRSPSAASLLLGQEQGRDVIEFELRNRDLHEFAIRDLHLPLDLHILSVRRRGQLLVSGGFTRLRLRDWVTVVGSPESLQQMMLKFDANREHEMIHLVERATSSELATGSLKTEVRAIRGEKQDAQGLRFDHLIRDSVVLDIPRAISCEDFFAQASEALSQKIGNTSDELLRLLLEREKESSTALRPDLAIPHIIIKGEHTFQVLLARCREGIHFSELAPRVQAVFVLAGTRDERNYHLYVLSAIARIVQAGQFEKRWLNAKSDTALQNVVRQLRVRQSG